MMEANENYFVYREDKDMRMTTQILKGIDIVAREVNFTIGNSSNKYKSVVGGVLSLILFSVSIALFCVFGNDMFNSLNPIVTLSNVYDKYPRRYNLTNDKFQFWLGIEDSSYNYFKDPAIYNVDFLFIEKVTTNGTENWSTKILKSHSCDQEANITTKFGGLFKNDPLSLVHCLDTSDPQNRELVLDGTFATDIWKVIILRVTPCKNSTKSSVVCKPQAMIDEKLKGGYIALSYTDVLIDPSNYTHPNFTINRNVYSTSSSNYFKEWVFYMKNVDFYSDNNFIVEDSRATKQSFLQTQQTVEQINFSTSTEHFVDVILRLSLERTVYTRRYKKLQDVLAQTSSFVYICYYLFHYLLYFSLK